MSRKYNFYNLNPKNIKTTDYTRSLAEEAMRSGSFTPDTTETVFNGIRTLAAELSAASDIPQQESDKSVRFVLDSYLESFGDNYKALQIITENDIHSIFVSALRYIKQLVFESTALMIKIRSTRTQVSCSCYNMLIDHKIKEMLSKYDCKYSAHSVPVFPEYPLASPIRGLCGIFLIKRYLINLYTENLFCACFDKNEAEKIYLACEKQNGGLPFNIYTKIYLNALFSDYLKKDHGNLLLTAEDASLASKLLSTLGENECGDILRNTSVRLGCGDPQYNSKTLQRILPDIMAAIRENTLENLLTVE